MDYQEIKKKLLARRQALKNARTTHIPLWKNIQEYVLPEHGLGLSGEQSANEHVEGADRMSKILDNTAARACDITTAGLQSGLTSPSRPWFRFGHSDPELSEKPDVRSYLFTCEERVRDILARTDTYTALHHCYAELVGFGTAAVAQVESDERVMHFRPFTAGEFYLAADGNNRVNTFYRDVYMTAVQLVDTFGEENCSEAVRSAYKLEGKSEEPFLVLHAVEPNDDRMKLPGKKWKFRSFYCEVNSTGPQMLRVGGFDRFPILAPRWFVVGQQVYGRGPGHRILPDVKQLQKETEKKLVALDKLVDPPTVSDGSPSEMEINSFPGGHTFDPSGAGKQGLRPLYQLNVPYQYILQDIQDLRLQIREGLFNQLFTMLSQMPAGGKMTAREVAERHEEKLIMLGPVLERLHNELLTPLIENAYAIANEQGLLPPPPPELAGQEFQIEFTSILAQAQKMAGVGSIEQFAGFVGSLVAVKPDVLDKVDIDEMVDIYADRTGVPPSVVVPDEAVLAMRERRAEQQAQAAQMEQGLAMAEGAKVLSETDTGSNTALSALLGVLPDQLGGGTGAQAGA